MRPIGNLPSATRWLLLLTLTVPATAGLHSAGLPAAFLLGPLAAAILLSAGGAGVQLPALPYLAAQGVLGCMIGTIMRADLHEIFRAGWPLLLLGTVAPIGVAALIGYLLSRWRLMPASTGIWGSMPGAATVMVLMSDGFGADSRIVAFMQYLRVLCVALVATLVALFFNAHAGGAAHAPTVWFPSQPAVGLALSVLVAVGGAWLGQRLGLPAGALLLPMIAVALLRAGGVSVTPLPPWLLVPAYALIGWSIGLRFSAEVLRYVTRLLPLMLVAIGLLLLFCGALSVALVYGLGLDPLTAYLA
ncbi:MAG: AbrB family transcriptional regulator, partial [Myxococcota bacterium]